MKLLGKILLWLWGHECPVPAPAAPPAVPFRRAVLCLDCDHITASRTDQCEHCQSSGGALLPLWSLGARHISFATPGKPQMRLEGTEGDRR